MISVHIENGEALLRRASTPKPKPGSVLIRLRIGGICNTDIELLRGYYGFRGRPGHEFVGDVVGPATSSWIGKRVVGEINLPCGKCEWCARGLGRHCPSRTTLGIAGHPGAFAEFLTLPETNLHEVPRQVPDEHAVFVEPIAAACEILDQTGIGKGSEVAVLGDGKLGIAGGSGPGLPVARTCTSTAITGRSCVLPRSPVAKPRPAADFPRRTTPSRWKPRGRWTG